MNRVAPTVDSIRQQILAVDGHSLLYRAYFALPDTIRDPHGRPVNAVHGFVSMLARLLRDHQPSGVLVAYDSPWPTIRHASFPGYKANRGVLPEALLAQVSISQAVLKRTGIPTLAVAGYEGDDILASLADYYSQHDSSVLIVTGDRDLFQLVRDPWVRVLYTKRGVGGEQILDEEGVKRLVGVAPSRYADLAALRGDLSDNIEGIAGIGEKTALAIISSAPSFEELCERPDQLPAGVASKLAHRWDTVLRNRELMRPLTNIPVDWNHLPLSWSIDASDARAALSELGLLKTYALLAAAEPQKPVAPSLTDASLPRVPFADIVRSGTRVCLVSCSAEKLAVKARAEELYTSALFRKSREWARAVSDRWYVLSAKHGLLTPEQEIESYDDSLKTRSSKDVQAWGDQVVSEIQRVSSSADLLFMLAGSTYTGAILNGLKDKGYRVAQPLEGMSIGRRLQWLKAALGIGPASGDLEAFYEILAHLASNAGGLQLLGEAGQRKWPDRGVYFFFEPGEHRFAATRPRVVRVGTHAVSTNSKATLWNRLRTHRGVGDGGGNHRSSIFRSHVGTAILHRDARVSELPDWGNQSAGKPTTKHLEMVLERVVSAAISQMRILCVEVRDEAGPRSDRAFLERNAIALLSTVGAAIDRPSELWLGNSSPHPAIKKSGLWNVNFVDEPSWDPEFLEVLDYYARATVGEIPFVNRSVAPWGWWDRVRARNQMNFMWNDDDRHAE